MPDNQPHAPGTGPDTGIAQSVSERARIAIVCATIVVTTIVYSTQFASFLHPKLFVLSCGLAFLGIATVFARRSNERRVGWLVGILPLIYVLQNIERRILLPGNVAPDDANLSFIILNVFLLPIFISLALGAFSCERNRRWVSISIVAAAACAALLGIGQYAGVLSSLFPVYPASSPIYSVFGNSGLLGGYIAIALPLALADYQQGKLSRPLVLATLALLACALLLTGSRTAWLACAIGCAVSVWKFPNLRATATVTAIVVVVAALCVLIAPAATVSRAAMTLTASDAGAQLRWWFWAGTWEMIKAYSVTGIGLGRYAMDSPVYLANVLWSPGGEHLAHNTLLTEHPHNDYLLIWAETGALGFGFCVWLAIKLSRCNGQEWGGIVGLLVFALFNSPLHSAPHALAGCLLGACLVSRTVYENGTKISSPTWGGRFVGLLAVLFPVAQWYGVIVPSYRLQTAQTAHVDGRPALGLYAEAAASPGFLSAEIDEKYGVALLDVGDYESARDRFASALERSDAGSVYLGLGASEYLLGNRTPAYNALEKAVYRWPSHLDAWRLLLRVCPDEDREDWLVKAARFLRSDEVRTLRETAYPLVNTP